MKQNIIDLIENEALDLSKSLEDYYQQPTFTLRASVRPYANSKTLYKNFSIVLFFYRDEYLTKTFRLFNTNDHLQVEDLGLQGNDHGRAENAWQWVDLR